MGHDFTTENIQTYLNDVAGVRIVCAFIDDIYMISDLITQQDDIKVIEVKDYICLLYTSVSRSPSTKPPVPEDVSMCRNPVFSSPD